LQAEDRWCSFPNVSVSFGIGDNTLVKVSNERYNKIYWRDQMKALVKKKAERGLWLEDVPEPEIGINDVLIKIHKTSICGTDVHIYT